MLLYLSIAGNVVLAIAGIILFSKYFQSKFESNLISQDLASHKYDSHLLEQEKIEYIKKIEQLSAKIEYQSIYIADFEKLRTSSEESSKAALFNLGNDLSKQLIDLHKKENQEARTLSEKNIKDTSEKFNSEFERLLQIIGSLNQDIKQSKDVVDVIKNSLLSPSGAGKLAEITLENILKASGLRANLDFLMQYHVATSEQSNLRPDAVIFLPSNNVMVIDAKASKFLVDNNQEDLQNLAKTMNSHLRSLVSKEYAQNVMNHLKEQGSSINHIITLMFLPTEHAIEKIIEADNTFLSKAWAMNIFPVGPSGLMNMLSFAKFQISEQMMLENHQDITEEVKKLISSILSLNEHASRMSSSIAGLVNHYDKFAASFNSNFLTRTRNIKKLGISSPNKKQKGEMKLMRYQLISSKSDIIDIQAEEQNKENENIKSLERA